MRSRLVLALLAAILLCVGHAAEAAERRIALVIGESAYEGKPNETAANDAGLIAQTLQAAGFDVSGARDLDEESLRGSLRDFLEKARNVGPDGVAFIYFAGAGAQLEGDNYLLPVGAPIASDADIPLHGARLSDYLKPLASMGLKTAVIVLDAARALPYRIQGQPLAGGLALYEPGPSLLLAFNAAPGTIAQPEPGPYGVYAHALAEMIRAGGLPIAQVLDQTRLRVLELTRGSQIPWNSQGFDTPFIFFERTSQAPPRGVDEMALRGRPIAQFSAEEAFTAAVARDTLQSYQDFLIAFPNDPLAQRVRAILAARREALLWRKTRMLNTPAAYWTYVRTYPRGPHVSDARRLLAILASPPEPPPAFALLDLGYPPPPPPEIFFVSRPVIFFGDPVWGFAPPPPPPPFFLPPPPPDFVVLPPPIVVGPAFVLPVPPFVPVPVYVQPPAFVAPPPGNVFYSNLHNSVVVDANQNVVIANPQGRVLSTAPIAAGAVAGAAGALAGAAIGAGLPRFIAHRAAVPPGGAVPLGQSVAGPGQGAPQGLPPQGSGAGGQQPFQGSHALPQPGAIVQQGHGAPTPAPVPQTLGQGQARQPLPHDQGQAAQGAGSAVQQPASSHALPLPNASPPQGQGASTQGELPQPRGQGRHTQGQASTPQGSTAPVLPPPSTRGAQGSGHPSHGLPSQMQAPPSPSSALAPPPLQHYQGVHGHGGQMQGPGPAQMMPRPPSPPPQPMMQRPPGPPPQPMMQRPPSPPPQAMAPRPQPTMMQRQASPPPQPQRQPPPAEQPHGQERH